MQVLPLGLGYIVKSEYGIKNDLNGGGKTYGGRLSYYGKKYTINIKQ